MRWQDIVISIAQVCIIFAMWPSIKSKDKPALATSVMNVILVTIIGTCLFTLHLWYSALTAAVIAASWGTLAVQKARLDKKRR